MRNPTRSLLVLHADRVFRERLRRAARPRFEVCWVPDWTALPDAVRTAAPAGIVVVDPYHGQGARGGLAPELYTLLRAFPSATVVAAFADRPGWFHDIRTLGEWGVVEVIDIVAEDTAEAVRRRLDAARGRPLRSLLDRGVAVPFPGRGRAILDAAGELVAVGGHARNLAAALHLSPATLLRWCRSSGLPVPRRLLVWMRLLLAAEMLDDPGQTVANVALACGYSSDDALRRALYGVVQMGPTTLRQEGAFRVVSAAFVQALAECRRAIDEPASRRPLVGPWLDEGRAVPRHSARVA